MPTANNIPRGPSQSAIIATNFESPLPNASFLKIYLEKYLKDSKIKNAINEPINPFEIEYKSIKWWFEKLDAIKPKTPKINPKFIKIKLIEKGLILLVIFNHNFRS